MMLCGVFQFLFIQLAHGTRPLHCPMIYIRLTRVARELMRGQSSISRDVKAYALYLRSCSCACLLAIELIH